MRVHPRESFRKEQERFLISHVSKIPEKNASKIHFESK